MEQLLNILTEKAKNCGDRTKEGRARKGAYVDCIVMLKKYITANETQSKCPSCGNAWDMKKYNACECGASIKKCQ